MAGFLEVGWMLSIMGADELQWDGCSISWEQMNYGRWFSCFLENYLCHLTVLEFLESLAFPIAVCVFEII